MPNAMGDKTPQDWTDEGWFQVAFEADATRSEEIRSKVPGRKLEVRDELWRPDGQRLVGDDLPKVSAEGSVVVLDHPLNHAVYTVARWHDGVSRRDGGHPEATDTGTHAQRPTTGPRRAGAGNVARGMRTATAGS